MRRFSLLICMVCLCALPGPTLPQAPPAAPPAPPAAPAAAADPAEENPEGYYAFMESPNATPPRVRPPPYRQVAAECAEAGAGAGAGGSRPHVSAANLCGDLNRGTIPRNPMGQNPHGEPYPFELIRNHTLRFLSRTLPVLRADDTVPRVTRLHELGDNSVERARRSLPPAALAAEHRSGDDVTPARDARKFCDDGGVFCMLYRAFNGNSEPATVERREDPGHAAPRYEGPPTPCPARVEYATPVFARNYLGVWRYVVQIPYEGYFTQTVEVTRCLQARCHYLAGGCLSSPRWLSLLVAELHYPPPQQPEYQQFGNAAPGAGVGAGAGAEAEIPTEKPPHCDGHDELGCFQVRLYYDWFLVPGSCKCWRPDYFERYVRRRNSEL